MEFSLLYELANPKPWHARSEYNKWWEGLEQVVLAEKLGFDGVWAVEHHFLEELSSSSVPEIWLTACAMRTERIRIGHGVVLLPNNFNHPIRVAERIAGLDIMSNGRVEFGVGRGSSWQELGGFEVPPELSRAQVIENATIIPQMFQTDSFSYEGKFVNIPPRNVIPKPIQKPSPPMWMACGSDDTYEIAGELGLGVLAFAAKSPDYVGERIRRYKEKVVDAKPVTGVVNNKTAAFCMMYCGESDDEADETAGPTVVWYQDVFARYYNPSQQSKYKGADHRTFDDDGNETVQSSGRMKVHQKRPKATHEQMKKLMDKARSSQGLCVGSAESITKVLKRYEANQIDQVLCIVQSGMLQHEDIMRSLKRFAREVMPAFGRSVPQAALVA